MTRLFFLTLLILTTLTSPILADDVDRQSERVTDIYQPNNVSPEKLKNILTPLYPQDSLFSADEKQLIIRAPQPILNEIQSLLLQLDHPPRSFTVQFSHRKTNEEQIQRYSTHPRSSYLQNFTVLENSSLTVVNEHEEQKTSEISPYWFRVNHVPTRGAYLHLQLHTAGDFVHLVINRKTLEHGQLQEIDQQLSGPIGQWLHVSALHGYYDQGNDRRWSTRRDRNLELYIKVEPAP